MTAGARDFEAKVGYRKRGLSGANTQLVTGAGRGNGGADETTRPALSADQAPLHTPLRRLVQGRAAGYHPVHAVSCGLAAARDLRERCGRGRGGARARGQCLARAEPAVAMRSRAPAVLAEEFFSRHRRACGPSRVARFRLFHLRSPPRGRRPRRLDSRSDPLLLLGARSRSGMSRAPSTVTCARQIRSRGFDISFPTRINTGPTGAARGISWRRATGAVLRARPWRPIPGRSVSWENSCAAPEKPRSRRTQTFSRWTSAATSRYGPSSPFVPCCRAASILPGFRVANLRARRSGSMP